MYKINIDSIMNSNLSYNKDYYSRIIGDLENKEFIVTEEDTEIVKAVPLNLYGVKVQDTNTYLLHLYLLSKTKSEKLFNLVTIYECNEDEYEFIKDNIPFFTDASKFIDDYSNQLANTLLSNTLPIMASDFNFTKNNDSFFTIKAFNGSEVELKITPAVFSSIGFLNQYITDCVKNSHDIFMAICHGNNNTNFEIFDVNNINSIVHLTKIKEDSPEIAGVVQLEYNKSKDKNYVCELLFIFDPNVEFIKEKFDITIEELNNNYMKNDDQYITEFFFTTLINDDKYYSVYIAKNKNGEYKLFLLEQDQINKLLDMIDNF